MSSCCNRRRSRTPPPQHGDPPSHEVGAPEWPLHGLPLREKPTYPEGTPLTAPSAPIWSPSGQSFWQRSPLSGLMRRRFVWSPMAARDAETAEVVGTSAPSTTSTPTKRERFGRITTVELSD